MNLFNLYYDFLEREKRLEVIIILVIRLCMLFFKCLQIVVYLDKDEGGGGMRNDDVLKKNKLYYDQWVLGFDEYIVMIYNLILVFLLLGISYDFLNNE